MNFFIVKLIYLNQFYLSVNSSVSAINIPQGSNNVPCQNVQNLFWNFTAINVLTCSISSSISKIDTSIQPRNNSVLGLMITNQSTIYLPINVNQTFENLLAYKASKTLITSISRENFRGLSKLKILDLSENRLRKILNNTFVDLISLEYLILSKFEGNFESKEG